MGRLKNSPRRGVALRFLHITVIILMAGSVVVAVDSPQGSNTRRLADPHDSSNPTPKGQGVGVGHAASNVPNKIKDADNTGSTPPPKIMKDANNPGLTSPPKNITPGNAAPKGNSTSSDKEKLPEGSNNRTNAVPENGQGPQNDTTPPVNDKDLRKEILNNGTPSTPPDKDVAPNKEKGDPAADPGKDKSPAKKGEGNKDSSRNSLNPQVCDEFHSCSDKEKKMVACLRAPGNEMQDLSLLIQNKGEDSLQVNITAPAFLKVEFSNLTLRKEGSGTVRVSIIGQASHDLTLSKIVIDSGNGKCVLDVPHQLLNSPYKQRFFKGFSYSAIITPMFGVYLLLFTVLAIGGSWICCKLRGKRRHGNGIRYQELEMNRPESTLPITAGGKPEAENMDGWDEVWDDSWEDAEAARSSSRPMESLSSKGLASRKPNKDGWDNSWDD
ncbi:uncharacterized protein LOC131061668 isoform X2 [Cryptomeria japonica]|uniref:uncharacterized protein LOC131061668 isoform X2 n=1 Tax=Cryptomeria japonica TaxID=3369 RepID=UPI0027DA6542|nr:uncharacterized protein LOC131061668 isoform X2 [Cryptomeria japonica]